MRASSLVIFSLFLGCGNETIECRWSDDCSVKQVCEQTKCETEIDPPGPLIQGSQTTRCTKYNNSETGEPKDNLRFNDWCLSGIEKATECILPGQWTMVCY